MLCAAFLAIGVSAQKYKSDSTADIVLLLDCTGYMENAGVEDEVADALKLFVELLPERTRLSVVAFGNTWNPGYDFVSDELSYMNDIMGSYARTRVCLASELISLDSEDDREELSEIIEFRMGEGRYTHTNTYIGGGLMAALDRLFESDSDERAVFMLTNGRLSGFDSTDGVEWKRTNSELCELAVELAAENGIEIYSLELNTDGKNSSGSAAHELLSGFSKNTGGLSYVINESSADAFAEGMLEIISDMFGSKSGSDDKLEISKATSEVSIITSGNELTVNGKTYKNELKRLGAYSVLRLTAPFGSDSLTISGKHISMIAADRLSLELELDCSSSITRNREMKLELYLTAYGERIEAEELYENYTPTLSVNGEIIEMTAAESGWSAAFTPKMAGEYVFSAFVDGQSFGVTTASVAVEDYGFELELLKSNEQIAQGETITVGAFLTGTDGRVTDSSLYKDGEALLTVRRDGRIVLSDLAMSGNEGYYADFTADETGNYEFSVSANPECLYGEPGRIYASAAAECGDFTLDAAWSANDLDPVSTLQKSSIVKVRARLLGSDGELIERGRYLEDGEALLIVRRGGEVIDEVAASVEDGIIFADWRIVSAGDIELELKLGASQKSSYLSFKAVNHELELISSDKLSIELAVGESCSLKLSELVSDEDGDILTVTIDDDQLDWTASTEEITINAGEHSANKELTLVISDGDSEVSLKVKLKITNKKPEKLSELELPHFILNAPGFMFFVDYNDEAVSYELNEYFADPEGFALTFALETDSELVRLEGSSLEVTPSKLENSKLILTVTDSSDESIRLELRLVVDDWWTLNAKRVIITASIAAIALIFIAILIRRESNIGYLKLTSAKKGEEELEIIEKINRRRIRLWSLELLKLYKNRLRLDSSELPSETGRLTGHLIFGSRVTIVGAAADGYEKNGELINKKLPKKLVLRSGESITLIYGELKITLTNRN